MPPKTINLDQIQMDDKSLISLSPEKLQSVLGRTLVRGEISLLHGRSRSLLTLLAHFICANVATSGLNSLYLDSARNFSPSIIKRMSDSLTAKNTSNALLKVKVGKIYSLEDIKAISLELESIGSPPLIVIDNLTAILNFSTAPGKKGRQRRLFAALEETRRIVNTHNIHVLITDHSTADWKNGSFKPIGGNVVKHAVDSLSQVTMLETEDIVNIKVERSPHVTEPSGLIIRLNHAGAFELGL